MKPIYIYSTLTCDNAYTNYRPGGADLPIPLESVLVKGGAGVADARIVTPHGVVTHVTETQLEYLRENKDFQLHVKNGFIVVSGDKLDADNVAADMESRDASAPLVPGDMTQQPMTGEDVSAKSKRK